MERNKIFISSARMNIQVVLYCLCVTERNIGGLEKT